MIKRKPHSGISVGVLLDVLEEWAPTYSPQGGAITKCICTELFPLCAVTEDEIGLALALVRQIKGNSSHMTLFFIHEVERQIRALLKT